jgi:3-isopropylmalate dehydrogenase
MNMTENLMDQGDFKTERLLTYLALNGPSHRLLSTDPRPIIGVLNGTGIGPQVVDCSLQLLAALQEAMGTKFDVWRGGPIGEEAKTQFGRWLPNTVVQFCADVFGRGGAILSGPGGGRYVYDLRKHFDLFCKFVPVRPWPELARAGKISPQHLRDVDLLILRDNTGGVYQGAWQTHSTDEGQIAEHHFSYSELEVRRLVEVSARAAARRRGRLHVIVKDGGVPGITALWREVSLATAEKHGVAAEFMNVDLAAYELIQHPAKFDVLVAPNLFGDILADISGVLLSSRGVTFSGNYDAAGNGVYQTNHGCAHDIAGTDTANPAGQMLSLAMLLRESFGLDEAAHLIEESLAEVWRQGWRTADLAEPGCRIVGTQAITDCVVQQMRLRAEVKKLHETRVAAG